MEIDTSKLDQIITDLLPAIRMDKRIPEKAFNDFKALLDHYEVILKDQSEVPKSLVGSLYFVFTSMLAEADHAKEPDNIITAAWEI